MKLCGFEVGLDKPFFLIAGPCVIESMQLQLDTAGKLKEITSELGINFIFKSSFDKANRTSATSFRGPGLEEGLKVLAEVKRQIGVPVLFTAMGAHSFIRDNEIHYEMAASADKEFIVDGAVRLTFAQAYAAAKAAAGGLVAGHGVRKGDFVGIAARNSECPSCNDLAIRKLQNTIDVSQKRGR